MNIYQSITCRKDLSWLHLDDEPRVQERQEVKVAAIGAIQKYSMQYGRFIDIQGNQGSNFLRGSFSNVDNVRVPIQFRSESQPQHFKR